MQFINVWGIRITLVHVAFQGPIVTYPKIVEPWRGIATRMPVKCKGSAQQLGEW